MAPKKKQTEEAAATPKKEEGGQTRPVEEPSPTAPSPPDEAQKPRPSTTPTIGPRELIRELMLGLAPDAADEQKKAVKSSVQNYLRSTSEQHDIAKEYNIVILYDETRMVQSDTDSIYSAVTAFEQTKPILLILHSSGGYVGPAYLIGKLLREHSDGEFNIVVPRRAKSGATLLCCAGNRLHMGSLSELGPIDPQIEGLPALGLKSAIEHIAALVKENPHTTALFAEYMSRSIPPIQLGYYERVAESAVQYAERLLLPHQDDLGKPPSQIAKDLVYSYKDHGFVIDKQEAEEIFGDQVVLSGSAEYALGNAVYEALVFVRRIAEVMDHEFYFIGSWFSEPNFMKKRQ